MERITLQLQQELLGDVKQNRGMFRRARSAQLQTRIDFRRETLERPALNLPADLQDLTSQFEMFARIEDDV